MGDNGIFATVGGVSVACWRVRACPACRLWSRHQLRCATSLPPAVAVGTTYFNSMP